MHDGGLVVYDWEDSVPDGLALTDAFHFLFRQASLVGPWPGGQRVVEASQSHVSVLRRHLGLSGEIAELLLSVWALGQYVDRLSLHMEEVIGAIVSREQTS